MPRDDQQQDVSRGPARDTQGDSTDKGRERMADRHNLTRHGPGGKQKRSLLPISPVPRALTVHIAAQHGFLQWVHTALLQPLLDWGRVQADEVLGLTGAICTSASRSQPTSLPHPSLWQP